MMINRESDGSRSSCGSSTREEDDKKGFIESLKDECLPPPQLGGKSKMNRAGDVGEKENSDEFAQGVRIRRMNTVTRQTAPLESNQKVPPKNLVLDYRNMRKSGYFLGKQPKNPSDQNRSLPTTTDKVSNVTRWLDSVPEVVSSQSDLTDLDETVALKSLLNQLFTEEEECLKRLILEEGSGARAKLKFTSRPAQTLTYQQLDELMEAANTYVDKFLEEERGRGDSHREYEYVCGTVAFPESWSKNNDTADHKSSYFNFHWLKGRFSSEAPKTTANPVVGGAGDQNSLSRNAEEGQLILKPYHGPTFINGAVIKSGSSGKSQGQLTSLPGKIVEEVKTVLRAIHMALQKNREDPAAISSAKAPTLHEDAEMNHLTELLQKAQLNKKSALKKTVFVLKNMPESASPVPPGRNRQGTLFSRAISGMIQKRHTSRRPSYRIIRDARGSVYVQSTQVNPGGPARISQTTSSSRSFIGSGLRSFVRLVKPLKIQSPTPVAPTYQNASANDEDHVVIDILQQPPQLRRLDNVSREDLRPYHSVCHGQRKNKSNMKQLHKSNRC